MAIQSLVGARLADHPIAAKNLLSNIDTLGGPCGAVQYLRYHFGYRDGRV